MNDKKYIISLILGYIGVMFALSAVTYFNRNILMTLPLFLRMISMIFSYWLIALPVLYLIVSNRVSSKELGFRRSDVIKQITTGLIIGSILSLILTGLPHLTGFGDLVDNGHRYRYFWQFLFEAVYCVIAIGAVEELIFRGYFFAMLKRIFKGELIPIIGSSVLFGTFHLFGGNMIQLVMTAFIGIIFCILRLRVKNCTTLSLIIAHGVYDVLITVWAAVLR